MASKALASTALLLALSLLLSSSLASAAYCPPPPYKKPHYHSVPARPACPRDALKLGVCADVLGLINLNLGSPHKTPCCTLLDGLADLEAAVCLCTAIHANVLGIDLNVPVDLSLILNYCGKKVPSGFKC